MNISSFTYNLLPNQENERRIILLNPSIMNKRKDIQALRGVAVLLVLAFHADLPLPGGFIGVDVFFVISGYVIYKMLKREFELTGRISFKNFYLRRYLRLAPNLGLMISVTLIVSSLLLTPFGWQQNVQKSGFASLVYLSNLVLPGLSGGYFDLSASLNPFLHTWSLSVEEQFYFIFPLLFIIGCRNNSSTPARKRKIDLILLITLLSLTLSIVISQSNLGKDLNNINYFSPFTRIWEFGFGVLVAKINFRQPLRYIVRWKIIKICSLISLACMAFLINSKSNHPGLITLFPVICTSIFLCILDHGKQKNNYFNLQSLFSKIGDMSYSLYLWHWPFVVIAKAVWENVSNIAIYATIVSLVPAYLVYKFVEIPIKNKSKLSTINLRKNIFVWTLVPAILAISTWFMASKYWEPKFQNFLFQTQNFTSVNGECHFDSDKEKPKTCMFNSVLAQRPIYLIGDSNAAHFGPGLEIVANKIGRPLIITTGASCPLIYENILFNGRPQSNDCKVYYDFVIDLLEKKERGLVFISFSDRYFTDPHYAVVQSSLNNSSNGVTKYPLLIDSFDSTIRKIQSLGHEVIFINPIPHFLNQYNWNPRTCLLHQLLNGCEQVMPLGFSKKIQDPFLSAIKVVTQSNEVKNVDLSATICPNSICRTEDSEGWIYSDATHLTNSFSRRISNILLDLTSTS